MIDSMEVNVSARGRQKQRRGGNAVAFLLLLLFLAGMLLLRFWESEPRENPYERANASPSASMSPTATPSQMPEADAKTATPTPAMATETERRSGENSRGYTAETYQLVSDMLYIRRNAVADGEAQILDLLAQLRSADPVLGETWIDIMEYWSYANTEMPIHREGLPDDLPQDDSLCLVVLGFQLLYDGDMAPELLGRCQVALAAARQYPNAFIAVTGGGTAGKDRSITEAGVMADWFVQQGIDPERIIREDSSLTTDQNATNTCAILTQYYPQIKSLAIISSDYHLPLGCLMFTEAALLYGYEHGIAPFAVVSNAAWATDGRTPGYTGMQNQASYVWIMANPRY